MTTQGPSSSALLSASSSAPLLRLLQLADSGFPTGAFAFSHGLESLLDAGLVTEERHLAEVITAQVRAGFAGIECPAMIHAWHAARGDDLDCLVELDWLVDAMKPVPVFRNGSKRTGRRLLESAALVVADPLLDRMRACVRDEATPGHHPVAFGVVMAAAGVDAGSAALALGAGFVNSLATAAVRLGIIGAGSAQRLTARLHDEIAHAAEQARQTPIHDMGAYMPMVDIAGLRHAARRGRVFAS